MKIRKRNIDTEFFVCLLLRLYDISTSFAYVWNVSSLKVPRKYIYETLMDH